ncbi:hypothetical protein KUTeg_016745 [Tegillarca granosa]|uniref:Carboxylesterase type B domain-containing protein n=1 Tax=Tegillarca granosa TaxID=220873 RepID=A0ABQ9EM10_TEGGR|nr:hypothetical protein KUTeg_016745 [Tegillarca granosa]
MFCFIGVIHGDDLIYLSGFPLIGHENFRFDENDKKMSKMILHLWSNFIRNGLPSLVPHRDFFIDRYTVNRPVYARFLSGIHHPQIMMEINLKPKKMYFWNEQIPTMKKRHIYKYHSRNCSDRYIVNNPNSWALIATCIGLSVLTISFSVGYFRTRNRMNRLNRQNGLPITNRMV